jgi:murein DD-endopeptidase MepM/ murein hydrolase activator NlpD
VRRIFGDAFRISRWYIPGHDGVDLPAKVGTPIRAVASGTVSYARDARIDPNAGKAWAIGGGNTINIDIGGSKTTQYAHLDRMYVKAGDVVKRGQIIGTVGSTGGDPNSPTASFGAAGAHLHFGLWDRRINKMVDPTAFLAGVAAGWNGPLPDAPAGSMGGWGVPEGTILTRQIVDQIIARMDAAGLFKTPDSNPITEAMAIDTTRKLLYAQIGKPWNPATTDALQQDISKAARDANALGSIAGSLAGFMGAALDPANWVRILALLAGAGVFAFGTYGVLKGSSSVRA